MQPGPQIRKFNYLAKGLRLVRYSLATASRATASLDAVRLATPSLPLPYPCFSSTRFSGHRAIQPHL
jgi:hypothetical protein